MPEFVIRRPEQAPPESPEALFRELRPRDPHIRDLYLRQGELLRKYTESAMDMRDVALELQTGAEKLLLDFSLPNSDVGSLGIELPTSVLTCNLQDKQRRKRIYMILT
jgi:hypothetical protein